MDLIEQLLRRILAFIGVEAERATALGSTIMHSLIVYLLLAGSGIAIFAPSFWLMSAVVPIVASVLLASLLGISEWSEWKVQTITNKSWTDWLMTVLIFSLSLYLTAVGVGISILIEFGMISQLSWELFSIFVFVAAFLVYSLSDLPEFRERNMFEHDNSKGEMKR